MLTSRFESYQHPLERRLYDVAVRLIGSAVANGDLVEDLGFNLDLREGEPVLKLNWSR